MIKAILTKLRPVLSRKKIFIISILMLMVFLTGCVNDSSLSSVDNSNDSKPVASTSADKFFPMSDSQDGIDVTVEDVIKTADQTVIKLSINNHRYDLAGFDIENRSNFSGVKPIGYMVDNSATGGHHIQVKMTFDQKLSGLLVVGLDDSLIFNFDIK